MSADELSTAGLILRYLLIGKVTRDFIISLDKKATNDIPAGPLLYCAAGLALWDNGAGLVGKVGEDYPIDKLEAWSNYGFDLSGVIQISTPIDARRFFFYPGVDMVVRDNPLSHYSQVDAPLPKPLLGYTPEVPKVDSKNRLTAESITPKDIPPEYLDATFVHLCPLDYLSHFTLPTYLRQKHATTITLHPSPSYFQPLFWEEIPGLVKDLTALHCSEEEIRGLFQGKTTDIWEMAETLAGYGVEYVTIYRQSRGQYLYHRALNRRWTFPPYPSRILDPTGELDAYCGGFLAGFRDTYDPVEAVVYGNISASIKLEGIGPGYLIDTLPGLAKARCQTVRSGVRQV